MLHGLPAKMSLIKMDVRQVSNTLSAFVNAPSLLICLGLLLCYLFGNKYGKGLAHIPGPAIACCTGLWRLWDVRQGSAHLTHIRLHQQYGSLVRIGPNHVSIGDAKAIPSIYGLKSGFTKVKYRPLPSDEG